ncbi:MAG: M48 family metallopeptidase [Elusimicrobiota bacterium]|nr:M48 family metallopeptidase [Elusimicrobiota bacterium]
MKHIKYMRLRISRDCIVSVSVPFRASHAVVERFIESKKVWIEKHLKKLEIKRSYNYPERLENGGSIRLLGRQYSVELAASLIDDIFIQDFKLMIFSRKYQDLLYVQKQYKEFFQQGAQAEFKEAIDEFYPIFAKYNIKYPLLKFKTMKTMWGNCNIGKGVIAFNYNLYKSSKDCIKYVALHELTHLMFKNHNADFYNFIETQMPDWKLYKKKLNFETMELIF